MTDLISRGAPRNNGRRRISNEHLDHIVDRTRRRSTVEYVARPRGDSATHAHDARESVGGGGGRRHDEALLSHDDIRDGAEGIFYGNVSYTFRDEFVGPRRWRLLTWGSAMPRPSRSSTRCGEEFAHVPHIYNCEYTNDIGQR